MWEKKKELEATLPKGEADSPEKTPGPKAKRNRTKSRTVKGR